jgi:predicted HAD superfamily Cof-like phosphohydrolase
MLEEFGEVVEAILKEDMVGLLKEFCDQQIVNQGSVQVFGLAEIFTMGMHLVCDSNMSKLVDGKPVKNEVGRIQKGPNYRPPNLLPLFERYRSEGK